MRAFPTLRAAISLIYVSSRFIRHVFMKLISAQFSDLFSFWSFFDQCLLRIFLGKPQTARFSSQSLASESLLIRSFSLLCRHIVSSVSLRSELEITSFDRLMNELNSFDDVLHSLILFVCF